MEAGIALLLTGTRTDLSATVHAVALARRTTGILHAVCKRAQQPNGKKTAAGETEEQSFSLVSRLGNQEGVKIHTHTLEKLTGEPLIRFLCAQRVFCLVLGVNDRQGFKHKTAWVNQLRRQLQASKNWYLPPLWSVIMTPWGASTLEQVISEVNGRSQTLMPGESPPVDSERIDIFSMVSKHNKNE